MEMGFGEGGYREGAGWIIEILCLRMGMRRMQMRTRMGMEGAIVSGAVE